MAADYRLEIRDPENPDEGVVDAVFPGDWTSKLYKFDPVGYENLRAAKYVLENTRRIFRGLRVYNRGGWCYVGRPGKWCIREDVVVPFPEKFVFAVYMNPRLSVFEARAEYRCADDPMSPKDWPNRYEALVWTTTS